ncbi:exonuclease rnase t/dna polymerase iii [Trichococcus palustris]|uniref:DNA polymerase III polC-type n=1 Tax=Trichococcus palustris TaxID=140314 RepID=A0A143Y7H5_9LACT|nr:exonuclease domain-containing protein [Trichococcus palustris]CZQ81693.1 exonuclease rnase t/dna polymerase iii [Trichococcus palustris]SFK61998.1 DNA polymerase-3 subunit epsilon [Trichococcus palustris]
MDYVAIDFETANTDEAICSIGMVKYSNGKEIETFYSLINPEEPFYFMNSHINGIYEPNVQKEKNFKDIFPEIMNFIGESFLVAHTAQNDMRYLRKAIEKYDLPKIENEYICSMKIAKKTYNLKNYTLKSVSRAIGIKGFDHHNALEDARICALIFEDELKYYDGSINGFTDRHLYKTGKVFGNGFVKTKSSSKSRKYNAELINHGLIDETHILFEKNICFTGHIAPFESKEEAENLAESKGANVKKSIVKNLDILVSGEQTSPNAAGGKLKQAYELKEGGKDIEIMSVEEFLSYVL